MLCYLPPCAARDQTAAVLRKCRGKSRRSTVRVWLFSQQQHPHFHRRHLRLPPASPDTCSTSKHIYVRHIYNRIEEGSKLNSTPSTQGSGRSWQAHGSARSVRPAHTRPCARTTCREPSRARANATRHGQEECGALRPGKRKHQSHEKSIRHTCGRISRLLSSITTTTTCGALRMAAYAFACASSTYGFCFVF